MLMSVRPARMKSRRNAVGRALSASAIGSDVATKVRKTTISTRSAASRPSSSCVPCSMGGNSASPLNSAFTPAGSTGLAHCVLDGEDGLAVLVVDDPVELGLRVGDAPIVGNGVLAEGIAHALDARLVLGRLELVATSGARSPPRSPPCAPAVSSRRPAGAAKTRFSTPPCSAANSFSIRSVAFWVSEPGISNSSLSDPPTVATRTTRRRRCRSSRRRRATDAWRSARPARKRAGRETFVGEAALGRLVRVGHGVVPSVLGVGGTVQTTDPTESHRWRTFEGASLLSRGGSCGITDMCQPPPPLRWRSLTTRKKCVSRWRGTVASASRSGWEALP